MAKVTAGRSAFAWLVVLGLLAAAVIGVLTFGGFRLIAPPPIVSPSPSSELRADASAPAIGRRLSGEFPQRLRSEVTPIDLPDYPADVAFADCSIWAQSQSNGGGIARIDPATGTVVATIVPDEVVASMTAHDGAVYAVAIAARSEPGDTPRLVRIDPATNLVADVVGVPTGGDMAILGDAAWVRNTRTGPAHGFRSTAVRCPGRRRLRTLRRNSHSGRSDHPGQTGRLGRFDATGRLTSIGVGDVVRCAIAETGIACADGRGHVVFGVARHQNRDVVHRRARAGSGRGLDRR